MTTTDVVWFLFLVVGSLCAVGAVLAWLAYLAQTVRDTRVVEEAARWNRRYR